MAEQWAGRTFSKNMRFNDLFGAGYTAHGDFTFSVGKDGKVHGQATVAYELIVDVARMNEIIKFFKSAGEAALGYFGQLGSVVSNLSNLGLLVRVGYETEQQLTIRSGPISGVMTSDALKLEWAERESGKFEGIPLTVYYEYRDKKDPISKKPLSVESPWPAEAKFVDQGQVTKVHHDQFGDDTKSETSAYWTAHRVDD